MRLKIVIACLSVFLGLCMITLGATMAGGMQQGAQLSDAMWRLERLSAQLEDYERENELVSQELAEALRDKEAERVRLTAYISEQEQKIFALEDGAAAPIASQSAAWPTAQPTVTPTAPPIMSPGAEPDVTLPSLGKRPAIETHAAPQAVMAP